MATLYMSVLLLSESSSSSVSLLVDYSTNEEKGLTKSLYSAKVTVLPITIRFSLLITNGLELGS